jgi:hypothetical protein
VQLARVFSKQSTKFFLKFIMILYLNKDIYTLKGLTLRQYYLVERTYRTQILSSKKQGGFDS